MVHTIRFIMWIVENAEPSNVGKFVVENVGQVRCKMHEAVKTVADVTVTVKIIQTTKRTHVNLVKWKVSVSQS